MYLCKFGTSDTTPHFSLSENQWGPIWEAGNHQHMVHCIHGATWIEIQLKETPSQKKVMFPSEEHSIVKNKPYIVTVNASI